MARDFFDVVAMHDVKDLISDPLSFTTSSHGGQYQANEVPAL
jgi:hypothetical protein